MKPFRALSKKFPAILLLGAVNLLPSIHSARAGNTWTGGGASTNWSDNNNWGGAAPGYGTLTFTTGGPQGTTSNNNSITAMNQLLWTGSASWTLNGSTTLSLFDNGGTQAKIENQSTGLVTINAPITFAANNGSPPNPFGEINAVNGDLTFGTGTLTVNGSSVNGIKLFGSNHTATFNNTVSASGKWFGMTQANDIMAVGGAFTSGDIYVMNSGTLKVNSGANITTSALRLGGDFGNTGNQNQTLGGTLQFTVLSGGQTFGSVINSVSGNTSNALLIDSLNTSGTNTISGSIFLDSNLRVNQASGGTLSITNSTLDVKGQTLTLTGGSTGNINITDVIGSSTGVGQLVIGVNNTVGGPTVTLSNASTYTGDTFVRAGTLAFTSSGSAASSTIRLGSTGGTSVDANLNLTTAAGGTTISSILNPVGGTGTLTVNSQNTSGTNTLSGHIGMDRGLTITQSAGGTLSISSVHTGADTGNTLGTDIKANTLTLTPSATGSINYTGTLYNSSGSGIVTLGGAGTLTLSGTNTYTGGTNINAGILNLGSAQTNAGGPLGGGGAVGTVGTIKFGSGGIAGTLQFSAANTTDYSARFSNAAGQAFNIDTNGQSVTFASQLLSTALAGTLTKLGSGTLTLTSAASRYTGATTISGGTLAVSTLANGGSDSSIGTSASSAANLVFDGGTLKYTGSNVVTDRAFTINAAKTATIDTASNLTLVGATGTATSGALTKAGGGALSLTGASTFTGATTVNAGTLGVAGSLGGTTSIAVNTGGTLLLSGAGGSSRINDTAAITLGGGKLDLSGITSTLDETVGTLTLSANSIIDFGTLAAGNTLRFADSSALTWTTATTLSIYNWTTGADHLFVGANSSGLLQSQLDKIKFYSDAGTTILPFTPGYSGFTGSVGEIVPVPEPGSVATVLALLGLAAWRERRTARVASRALA